MTAFTASAGPVAIVSGGSRGIGLAIVETLLARGDRVATFARSGAAALAALAEAHPGRLFAGTGDAAVAADVRRFVAAVVERYARIDHCIANAAIAREGLLAVVPDADVDALLAVNVKGAAVLARECVRQMLVQPRGDCPSVTFLSSVVAARGGRGLAVYAATKAALEGLARSLALELGPRGIRVNAIAPGFVETELSAALTPERRARLLRRTPLGRLGTAADVAAAVRFLTSTAASFITAQTLAIDGGLSA